MVAIINAECVLKSERSIFSRILFFASLRGIDMKYVLEWPLRPIHWSLLRCDSTPRKTNKAPLGKHLQEYLVNNQDK